MRSIITLMAISAALSASILTGLASADVSTAPAGRPRQALADPAPALPQVLAWNRPAAKPEIPCSLSAWSYADGFCVTDRAESAGPASARRVRIIRLDAEAPRIDGSHLAAASAGLARR